MPETQTEAPLRLPREAGGGGAGADGRPAVAHGSRVKVRLALPGGGSVDRIPAWIRWATVEPRMDAKYDGVLWDPPAGERHQWCALPYPALPLPVVRVRPQRSAREGRAGLAPRALLARAARPRARAPVHSLMLASERARGGGASRGGRC